MTFSRFFLAVVCLLSSSVSVLGQVVLPRLISDGMVLQRNAETKIWGWASEEEPVSISFQNKKYETTADNNGNWSLILNDLEPGGPFDLIIKGKNRLHLQNVYVGDVWLASGQSNMEISMARAAPLYGDEIATASNEAIRYFEVPKDYNFKKAANDLPGGTWKPVNSNTIEDFSAVAYFFAKNLYNDYEVPVGLINSSLGGSPAEAWLSEEALKKFPEHYREAQRFMSDSLVQAILKNDRQRNQEWYSQLEQKDPGAAKDWKNNDFKTWQTMRIPGYWADTESGFENGSVWFKKDIHLPEDWSPHPVKLLLGRIVDADSVFVNGHFVGNTTYQYPPRRYTIPAGVLKKGKNTITVKVINSSGRGGFVPDKPYKIVDGYKEIDLTGEWRYKTGAAMLPLEPQTFVRWKPLGLYNAMIHPLTNYSIKGVIWYQGESNTDDPEEYSRLFPALITNWRDKWDRPYLPFLFVQLANFMETKEEPADSNWARLREAQSQTLTLPKTGMAVTIDVGEWNDIHPLNKKAVGDRLARAAKNVAYDEEIIPGGPLFDSLVKKGDSIVISFDNVGKGLIAKGDGNLRHFAIAGKNRKFVWAKAEIRDNKVVVYSPKVEDPVTVRYAWADNPEGANLYNNEGLPAAPFRTDDWQKKP